MSTMKRLLFVLALLGMVSLASAQTDITGVVDEVSGYWTAAQAVAIGVLLFVIGRRVIRKI